MAEEVSQLSVPRSIGRYEIVGHLASGGMAEVFLARMVGPSGFERPVVIKRILPHLARQTAFVDMFLDEARIVAQIRHPNVVHVEELGRDGAELFLAMEYLEGETASGLIRRLIAHKEMLGVSLAAHLVAEACAGLHAAHELTDMDGRMQNLVHRDVSPQNLFVTYSGGLKVIDFGIAKAADRATRTEAGQVKGKLQYMSPEQCLSKPIARTSDIFALGTVLYELSTGRRLFKMASPMHVLKAICELPIAPPSAVVPDYPASLERICVRALAKSPADRYQTAAEMRKDLLLALRGLDQNGVAEEALASLMRRIFADRIEAKSEMLRRVRSGSAVTSVPAAETDDSVEIPGVDEMTRTDPSQVVEKRGRASRWSSLAAAALGIVSLAGSVVVYTSRAPKTPIDRQAIASAPSTKPPEVAAAVPSPTSLVVIAIETTPPDARVFVDGVDRGMTPFKLEMPKDPKAVRLEVKKEGFLSAAKTLTVDSDQHIALTLTPTPTPRGNARGKPKPPSTAPSATSGFYLLP